MHIVLEGCRNQISRDKRKHLLCIKKFSNTKDILTQGTFSIFLSQNFQVKVTEFLAKMFTYIEGISCIFIVILLLFIFIPDEKFHGSENS